MSDYETDEETFTVQLENDQNGRLHQETTPQKYRNQYPKSPKQPKDAIKKQEQHKLFYDGDNHNFQNLHNNVDGLVETQQITIDNNVNLSDINIDPAITELIEFNDNDDNSSIICNNDNYSNFSGNYNIASEDGEDDEEDDCDDSNNSSTIVFYYQQSPIVNTNTLTQTGDSEQLVHIIEDDDENDAELLVQQQTFQATINKQFNTENVFQQFNCISPNDNELNQNSPSSTSSSVLAVLQYPTTINQTSEKKISNCTNMSISSSISPNEILMSPVMSSSDEDFIEETQ